MSAGLSLAGSKVSDVKARLWTALGVVVVLGVLAAVAVPVVRASDWANTTLRTAASAASQPPLAALPSPLNLRWSAPGIPPSSGQPVAGGTVVVASQHRIEGRDAATGATRWYYQRDNASLCAWLIQDGVVFAAYRKTAGCRDLTALDAGTGARKWYRNADLDPDITLTAMSGVLIAGNAEGLFAVDTGGSLDRWSYQKPGCRLSRPVLGRQGVGVLLTCANTPSRITLLDAYTGKERWITPAPGAQPAVLAVDQEVSVLSIINGQPTRTRYDPTGKRLGAFSDRALTYSDPAKVAATVYSGLIIGWTGNRVFAVRAGTDRLLWTTSGTGPVTATPTGAVLASADGFVELALVSGRTSRSILALAGIAAPPTAIARVGASVLTAGPDGTRVYG